MWLYKLRRDLPKDQRGQSLVELALILPVILIILFGILEFGRIFHSYLVITNAAREGARVAAVGKNDTEIEDRIRDASPLNQAETKLQISKIEPNESGRTPGVPVTVEVTYHIDLITPFISDIITNPTLRAQATMRIE